MDDAVNPKRRVQFLRNAKLMRKRGTSRGQQAMVVAGVAKRIMPLASLPPIERYRAMAREECAKTLSENIRCDQLLKRKEIVLLHQIVTTITDILAQQEEPINE